MILFAFVLLGCEKVQIKDAEVCGDAGEYGATCFHTQNDQERKLTKEEWDKERFGKLCTDAENYANWKEAMLKLCNRTKRCTYEEQLYIEAFGRKVDEWKLR